MNFDVLAATTKAAGEVTTAAIAAMTGKATPNDVEAIAPRLLAATIQAAIKAIASS